MIYIQSVKKIIIILLCLNIIVFAIIPKQKAHAIAPVAIPASATAATGAYAVASLAVAGLAGLAYNMGSDNAAQIQERAMEKWEDASQGVKDDWNRAVSVASATGSAVVEIPDTMADWYKNTFVPDFTNELGIAPVAGLTLGGTIGEIGLGKMNIF